MSSGYELRRGCSVRMRVPGLASLRSSLSLWLAGFRHFARNNTGAAAFSTPYARPTLGKKEGKRPALLSRREERTPARASLALVSRTGRNCRTRTADASDDAGCVVFGSRGLAASGCARRLFCGHVRRVRTRIAQPRRSRRSDDRAAGGERDAHRNKRGTRRGSETAADRGTTRT